MSSSSSTLDQLIHSNKVVLFGTEECLYCLKAKSFLRRIGYSSREITMLKMTMYYGTGLRQDVIVRTGIRTVPVIFINGKMIGGYSDLKAYYNNPSFQENW